MPQYSFLGPQWSQTVIDYAFVGAGASQGSQTVSDAIEAELRPIIRAAFARWAEVSGLTFHEVADPGAAEIKIGWGMFGAAARTIGETAISYVNTSLDSALVRLEDPDERHLVTSDGKTVYEGTQVQLYSIALHEIGHALGLGHNADLRSIMYPTLSRTNSELNDTDISGIRALYSSVSSVQFTMIDPTTLTKTYVNGEAYSGPVASLQYASMGTASNDVIIGTAYNDFVNAGEGDDAVNAGGGNDVLDGGGGSNFLSGGAGQDVFFLDGRGGKPTWSTITDWTDGEQLSLWGWQPGVSKAIWRASDGLVGYQGATLHADLNGDGKIDASVTWVGIGIDALPKATEMDGLLWLH